MMEQLDLFRIGKSPLKITKPIRLIELFAGYGSQALALKYLGVPFEHWKISEWAIKSIQAYKDMHFHGDHTDYSERMTADEIRSFLIGRISRDYNAPLSEKQVQKMKDKDLRTIYNNMIATHNIGSVVMANGKDLQIVDPDKFTYVLTYSFPCQDLSNAGLGKGMRKGSGTRSGLLWEVERLLNETENLPQILIMENVPAVIGNNNIDDFRLWIEFLNGKGYESTFKVINATEQDVPQNRERCFMVSWLGDYYFDFPDGKHTSKCMEDVLEDEVDGSYYLSQEIVDYVMSHSKEMEEKGNGFRFSPVERERECGSRRQSPQEPDREWMTISSLISCGNINPSGQGISGKVFHAKGLSPTLTTACKDQKIML